jgi:broad specificity phosphatase PhoE
MMRQVERKRAERVLIVTHGLTIRCFVMRFLHLSVEEFDSLANPRNCAVVTIADRSTLDGAQFTSGRWGVDGLALRPPDDR